jgi:hypothetical protein
MRDNFSNPNPFLSSVKNYQELVNQPTAGDAMADATRNGMTPNPSNEGEHLSNALMGGFAGGMKAHENQKRQEKLSPMLERAGQITAKAAELEAQMQDETQTKMDTEKFYRRVAPAMLERSKAALAGDTSAVSELDKYIYSELQRSVNDPSLGPYSHSNGSNTYFTNNETGVDEGRNLMQTMYQYGIDPAQIFGKDAMNVEIGYSPGAKLKYEDERKMLAAELAQKNSVTSVNNAHAGNYNAQTEKTKHEMDAPKVDEYKEKRNIAASLKNQDEVYKVITPKIETQEKTLDMYDRLETALDSATLLRGDSSTAAVLRFFAREFGVDENIATANMTGLQLESKLKEMLGAQFGQQEGERILGKMVGPDKNYPAAKKQIAQEKKDLIKDIVKNRIRVNTYAQQEHANLEHPELYKNLDNQIKDYEIERKKTTQSNSGRAGSANNNGMVNMTNSFGQIFQIPADQVEAALHDEEEPLTLVK